MKHQTAGTYGTAQKSLPNSVNIHVTLKDFTHFFLFFWRASHYKKVLQQFLMFVAEFTSKNLEIENFNCFLSSNDYEAKNQHNTVATHKKDRKKHFPFFYSHDHAMKNVIIYYHYDYSM